MWELGGGKQLQWWGCVCGWQWRALGWILWRWSFSCMWSGQRQVLQTKHGYWDLNWSPLEEQHWVVSLREGWAIKSNLGKRGYAHYCWQMSLFTRIDIRTKQAKLSYDPPCSQNIYVLLEKNLSEIWPLNVFIRSWKLPEITSSSSWTQLT